MQPNSSRTGATKTAIYDAGAKLIKELVWRYGLKFTPTKRPICLCGSRRSGSSLLMEVIAVNQGILYSDQPFTAYTANSVNLNRIPLFPYGQIAYPDRDEQEALRRYMQGVLHGSIRANWPWKIFSPEFHYRNDRICLKITDGKLLIDWIASNFDVDTVVLTRHPISQALSVKNLGWFTTGKGLLRNEQYVAHWLDKDLVEYCWDVYASASELEWRVLDWALENLPLVSLVQKHPNWLYVSYERLIAEPQHTLELLCDKLQLPECERMLARLRQPSRSTRRESTQQRKTAIASGDQMLLLNSWRKDVSPADVARCFAILEQLNLRLYSADSPFPDMAWLGRETGVNGVEPKLTVHSRTPQGE